MNFSNSLNLNKDSRKQTGLLAQKAYPKGYCPVKEHPVLFCKGSDRGILKERLNKQPWKNWYETLHRPMAEIALAAQDLKELQSPGFHLKVFPFEGDTITPVQSGFTASYAVVNCAFVGFLEDNKKFTDKARQLLLEYADSNWCIGGWGGEDYEIGSGWDHAWVANAALASAYDLIANSFSQDEKRVFEARLARDLEWCQTDPISPRYNPSWFGSVYMGIAALLLGREDYIKKTEAMLDQYVDQVLWGEGEYFEGASYQSGCMEPQNIVLMSAIFNVTGRNPADNQRWAMRAEHWLRRASPLGTDMTHSDANLVSPTAQILLASISFLPPKIGSWAVWMYERIGDPKWLALRGNDEERRQGIDRPTMNGAPKSMERHRRYPFPYGMDPCFWLMTPDPLPLALEPPTGSYVARNAGIACLRTNWSLESMNTSLFAPRFYGSPHSHWDSLTFDFWAHGAYLIKNVGYHELYYAAPHVPQHLHKKLNIKSVPNPIKPPAPWETWDGWDSQRCFRMAPDMHNIPTIDGGGGNHWTSRADPISFIVNTGWAQATLVDGGVAASYSCIGKLGTDGKVVRALIQIEPTSDSLGYLVVVDGIRPIENPQAKCSWFLHPRGEQSGTKSRPLWTTCDFLNYPARDVRLEVCLPPVDLNYEFKPDGCHLIGGSFQAGKYIDVTWKGARRFWAVLRPAKQSETLPSVKDLPNNLGVLINERDLVLIRKIDEDEIVFEGIFSNASTLVIRDKGADFYLAVAASKTELGGGIGFEASVPLLFTAKGLCGTFFVDRPHKQTAPMAPVRLTVNNPKLKVGQNVICDGEIIDECRAGSFTVTIVNSGMHEFRCE